MNRRSFFKRMFVGVAAAVGFPLAVKADQLDEEKLMSIRDRLKSNDTGQDIIFVTGTTSYDGLYKKCGDGKWERDQQIVVSSGGQYIDDGIYKRQSNGEWKRLEVIYN